METKTVHIIQYYELEELLEDEFGLPHEKHTLFDPGYNEIRIGIGFHWGGVGNDTFKIVYDVLPYPDMTHEDIWVALEHWLEGESPTQKRMYTEEKRFPKSEGLKALMRILVTQGKLPAGDYFVEFSW